MVKTGWDDTAAAGYLAELERAAAALPPDRRAELLVDVRSHIEVARSEARSGSGSEADGDAVVRGILEQLGSPQEIVAAALSDLSAGHPAPPVAAEPTGLAAREIATILLLLFGGFLCGAGWFVGLFLLWTSRRWSPGDKLLGTLALPGGLALAAVVCGPAFLLGSSSVRLTPGMVLALVAVLLVAQVGAAIRLAVRARRS